MKRRRLLAALGTAGVSAGCLTRGGPDDTVTPLPTETTAETDTPADLPDASDAFADADCPEFAETDRTVCYHTATGNDGVVLAAEPDVFDPDRGDETVETLEFTLYNRSDWTVLLNPYGWAIHRRGDQSSTAVEPTVDGDPPLSIVEPGDSLRWELPEMTHPSPGGDEGYRIDSSLPVGTYAFSVTGSYTGTNLTETPTGDPPAETAFVALFRLETAVGDAGGTARP